ncbi:MAG: hypothetical protein KKF50_02870 [Nanoarchaeota archaeon]|nr:hypothetical protein [Nanoarchaeota archaeon]
MVKRSFWDWLAWIVLAGILLWLILKTVGIINTPLWLQYAPIYGAVYLAGWYAKKVEEASVKLNSISNEFGKFRDETVKEIHSIKLNCARKHG